MDLIKEFANSGVLGLILGFILIFFMKPLFESYRRNIDMQTEVLMKVSQSLDLMKSELEQIKNAINKMQNKRS
jgi:hypothetical protein